MSIFFLLTYLTNHGQNEFKLYDYSLNENADISVLSVSSYRKVNISLKNKTYSNFSVDVPCGTVFENSISGEQNLVVLFQETVYLDSKERKSREIITACMDASKRAPTNHSRWTIDNDKALGDLIRFYHNNVSIVSMMTGAEHHSTKAKKAAFLQMSVWAYFDADKKHILSFATKYMFNGNKEEAELFVDATLPLIKIFTNYYKGFNKN